MPSKGASAVKHKQKTVTTKEDFRSRTGRQRRARTSEKILEALFSLIDTRGIHEVSVDTLRHAAHLSRGAFYNYFNTLDEFLMHVSENLGTIINEEQRASANDDNSAIGQIAMFARYFVVRSTSDPGCAAILLRTLPETGAASEAMRRRMIATFNRAKEAKEIDVASVPHAVEIGLGVLIAMLRLSLHDGIHADRLSELTAMLLRALGVSKKRAAALSCRRLPAMPDTPLRSLALTGNPARHGV